MSQLPEDKFINYARIKIDYDESEEPNKTIWDWKKYEKKQSYEAQIIDLEVLIDLLNH